MRDLVTNFFAASWLVDNKLSLHIGKTECMLFGSSRKLKRAGDFRVMCEGTAITKVDSVKYLDVYLDSNMSGATHVQHTCNTRQINPQDMCR